MKKFKKTICSLASVSLILCGCPSKDKSKYLDISYSTENPNQIKIFSGETDNLDDFYIGVTENKEYLLIYFQEFYFDESGLYYNMSNGKRISPPPYMVPLERVVSENPDLKKPMYPAKYLYKILEYVKENALFDDYIYNVEWETSHEKVKTKTINE